MIKLFDKIATNSANVDLNRLSPKDRQNSYYK
jgi:hypothetical protein